MRGLVGVLSQREGMLAACMLALVGGWPIAAATLCEQGDTGEGCASPTLIDMRLLSEEALEDEGGPYRPGSFSRKVYKRSEGGLKGELPTLELEMTTRMVPGEVDPMACEIDGSLSYYQLGDSVEVHALIENEDCGASAGRYRVRVIARDEAGERVADSYNESWSRLDAEAVEVVHTYPLVTNGMLVRGSLRPVRDGCRCSALGLLEE